MDNQTSVEAVDGPGARAHRLLTLHEMLSAIFEEVFEEFKFIEALHALPKAARVCKSWMNPALDRLWRRVQLYQILSVLSPLTLIDEGWTFAKTPNAENWERFFFYAPRVRGLVYQAKLSMLAPGQGDQRSHQIYSHEVFHHLAQAKLPDSFEGKLLPNVNALSWSGGNVSFLPQMFPFVTSRLQDLRLRLFFLSSRQLAESDFSSFEKTIARLRQVPGLAPRKLHVAIPYHDRGPWLSEETSAWLEHEDLGHIVVLTLEGIRLVSPLATLERLHQLRDLSLTVNWASEEDAKRILATLAHGSPLLVNLALTFLEDPQAPANEAEFSFSTLRPLTSLANLVSLVIDSPSAVTILPDNVGAMGIAWPHLKVLSLSPRPFVAPDPTKLSTLHAFAASFGGRLNKLAIWLRDDESLPEPGEPDEKHLSRMMLDVGSSVLELERAGAVTVFLRRLFPHGVTVRSGPLPDPEPGYQFGEGWKKVEELLKVKTRANTARARRGHLAAAGAGRDEV